jgi:F-type H+-transporting ATPase subunit b
MLSLDYSLLIQIVTFIIVWQVLQRVLFSPVLDVLAQRAERTTGALALAEQMQATAAAARTEYERALAAARVQLAREAEVGRKAAHEESAAAIAAARAAAGAELQHLRTQLTAQVAQAEHALAGEANLIAFEMLDRVTGRAA